MSSSAAGPRFERVAIIGVGLIGGSFALALRAAGVCSRIVGAGRNQANMASALSLGVVDEVEVDAARAVDGADLVLLAAPVAQFPQLFANIAEALGPQALLTDAGSTKQDVVAAARARLGDRIAQFVPSHPIAGGELSGVSAAKAALFQGKRVVLSPLQENSEAAVNAIDSAWRACGARVYRMDPQEHDAVFAAVSHLPHLLAFALVHEFGERADAARLFGYAGGGFRDFTRIASSHPEMWRDICISNRASLLAELDRYIARLHTLRAPLEAGDGAAIERVFTEAREARQRWLSGEFDL